MLSILVLVGAFVAFVLAFLNGANNAGNTIGVLMGSRALPLRKGIRYISLVEFLGAFLLGEYISRTLTTGIAKMDSMPASSALVIVLASAISASLWVYVATLLKIPVSVHQALIGGIVGAALVVAGHEYLYLNELTIILVAWVLMPFISTAFSFAFYKLFMKLSLKSAEGLAASSIISFATLLYAISMLIMEKISRGAPAYILYFIPLVSSLIIALAVVLPIYKSFREDLSKMRRRLFNRLVLFSSITIAFSHGAHDVANAASPLGALVYLSEGNAIPKEASIPMEALLLASTALSLGILLWGWRVAPTVGEGISPVSAETGFISQLSASLLILMLTRLGLPTSTTNIIVSSIVGVGLARGIRQVNFRTYTKIMITWATGFPVALVAGGALAALLRYLL